MTDDDFYPRAILMNLASKVKSDTKKDANTWDLSSLYLYVLAHPFFSRESNGNVALTGDLQPFSEVIKAALLNDLYSLEALVPGTRQVYGFSKILDWLLYIGIQQSEPQLINLASREILAYTSEYESCIAAPHLKSLVAIPKGGSSLVVDVDWQILKIQKELAFKELVEKYDA